MPHDDCCLKIKDLRYEIINGMVSVIESLDPYTRDHSKNVANYALLLAEELGLSAQEIEQIHYGALFHDIGKVGIPLAILIKTTKLTDDEFAVIKTHPDKGARILEHFSDFKSLVPIVRHHHEKFGGGGYPGNLRGEEIPLGARIVAVADAYDAITTNRTYDKARAKVEAIEEIIKGASTQFDPNVVEAFVRIEKSL